MKLGSTTCSSSPNTHHYTNKPRSSGQKTTTPLSSSGFPLPHSKSAPSTQPSYEKPSNHPQPTPPTYAFTKANSPTYPKNPESIRSHHHQPHPNFTQPILTKNQPKKKWSLGRGLNPRPAALLNVEVDTLQGCRSTTELPRQTHSGEEILLFDCCGISNCNSTLVNGNGGGLE